MATKTIKVGDYVKTFRHGYTGRVYAIERLNPQDADWVRAQRLPLTLEQCLGNFARILVHDPSGKGLGGSVVTPIDACEKIPPIKGFYHICGKGLFK